MAAFRVPGNSESIITKIELTGTAIAIPTTPQSAPHKAKENNTIVGLKFSVLPAKRGSMKVPTSVWILCTLRNTQSPINKDSNWKIAKKVGNKVAIREPK